MSCHAIACWVLFPTCIWKLAFDSFQLLLRETVSHGGWEIHWVYSKKAKKVQYPVKVHMVQAKFNYAYRVHPSKDPTNMQLCADRWRVAQLLSCQLCNPGSHRKRDWNMMRLNSPSLTFVSILYFVLFYSKILDKCNHPQLSKPLFYLHSKFPVTTWTSNFLALNSLFPKTVTKCVQEGLSRAWSRTTNISNQ